MSLIFNVGLKVWWCWHRERQWGRKCMRKAYGKVNGNYIILLYYYYYIIIIIIILLRTYTINVNLQAVEFRKLHLILTFNICILQHAHWEISSLMKSLRRCLSELLTNISYKMRQRRIWRSKTESLLSNIFNKYLIVLNILWKLEVNKKTPQNLDVLNTFW